MTQTLSKASLQHIIVAYGDRLDYHHGAKYQMLSAYDKWLKREECTLTIVTDHPHLYTGYPCDIISLEEREKDEWSLRGTQHFGIKLMGFAKAVRSKRCRYNILLDTDMYWRKDPRRLLPQISSATALMYRDEGPVYNSRSQSIRNFESALHNRELQYAGQTYKLSRASRMIASNIIGITRDNYAMLIEAFELFKMLEPLVDSHTVEQFSISEIFRKKGIDIYEAKHFLNDWSSTGRKAYVSELLSDFFTQYGETQFSEHLKYWPNIKIKRPLAILLDQKWRHLKVKGKI